MENNNEEKKIKESITYIINLISSCVERGGFSVNDVIKINNCIEDFTVEEGDEEKQKKSIITLINFIHIAQSKGKLSLEEAHNTYKQISIFN